MSKIKRQDIDTSIKYVSRDSLSEIDQKFIDFVATKYNRFVVTMKELRDARREFSSKHFEQETQWGPTTVHKNVNAFAYRSNQFTSKMSESEIEEKMRELANDDTARIRAHFDLSKLVSVKTAKQVKSNLDKSLTIASIVKAETEKQEQRARRAAKRASKSSKNVKADDAKESTSVAASVAANIKAQAANVQASATETNETQVENVEQNQSESASANA